MSTTSQESIGNRRSLPSTQGPPRHRRADPGEIELVLDTAEAMKKRAPGRSRKFRRCEAKPSSTCSMSPARGHGRRSKLPRSAQRRHAQHRDRHVERRQGRDAGRHALNLEAMSPDMIVLRHASSGACHFLSRVCRSAIINAGDGCTSIRRRRCSMRSRFASARRSWRVSRSRSSATCCTAAFCARTFTC